MTLQILVTSRSCSLIKQTCTCSQSSMTVTAAEVRVDRESSTLVALAVSLRQTSQSAPNISTEVSFACVDSLAWHGAAACDGSDC